MRSLRFTISTLIPVFLCGLQLRGQQPEIFTRRDFQLNGPVKRLVVRANYGQEEFNFDSGGRLLKSLTRYSEIDFEVTHYIFNGDFLKERRDEVYRNGQCDRQGSIARMYHQDSVSNRILETLSSYDGSITEQISLQYDTLNRLTRVKRNYEAGIDITDIAYTVVEKTEIQHFSLNGAVYKTIRHIPADSIASGYHLERTENFQGNVPQTALEILKDSLNRILSEKHFTYNPESATWQLQRSTLFTYNSDGLPESQTHFSALGKVEPPVVNYIYQMDGSETPNWVRQVIVPQNSITAREVVYFE
jgi:hypothetical protein